MNHDNGSSPHRETRSHYAPQCSSTEMRHGRKRASESSLTPAHLRARKSHSYTCPVSPGWWHKGPLLRSHPPTWWPVPSCSVLPEWRLEDPCAWKSPLWGKAGRSYCYIMASVTSISQHRLPKHTHMNFMKLKWLSLITLLTFQITKSSSPTICMHSGYKVISHSFGLPQLVGMAVVHHVETVETDRDSNKQDKP